MSKLRVFNIGFVRNRKIYFTISILLVAAVLLMAVFGMAKLDIKFTGGTIATYDYNGTINPDDAQDVISKALELDVRVAQTTDFATENEKLVVTLSAEKELSAEQQQAMTNSLKEAYPDNNVERTDIFSQSAQAGKSFFIKCLVAVLLAFILIVLYIAIRFRKIGGFSAGVCGIIALLHDVLIAFGVFMICGFTIDDNFMAVVLTILGFSINDTIVVYDRIRENQSNRANEAVSPELVETSINQVFGRSIHTTLNTVLALTIACAVGLAAGVESILHFAFPMAIGLIAGAYSSICICGPLWSWWVGRKKKVKA